MSWVVLRTLYGWAEESAARSVAVVLNKNDVKNVAARTVEKRRLFFISDDPY